MEGKGITTANIRGLGAQLKHTSSDHVKAYSLLRKNIQEAWKLEKNYRDIEGQKKHLKSNVKRMERELRTDADRMHATSGNLSKGTKSTAASLPTVVVSPSTTRRSKLPWEKLSKGSIDSPDNSLAGASKEASTKKNTTLEFKIMPNQPKLKRTVSEPNKNESGVYLSCRKLNHENREQVITKAKMAANEDKEPSANHLQIPSPKQERTLKACFQQPENESNEIEPEAKERTVTL